MNTFDWSQWAIYYPYPGEEGFDGIHYGGIKCLKDDAPEWAKKAFEEYKKMRKAGYK